MKCFSNLAVLATVLSTAFAAPSATLDSGVVVGTATSLPNSKVKVNKYLGIPFAQPPTGDGRFAPPVQVKSWSKPKKATAYAPACVQQFSYPAATRNETIALFDTPGPPAGENEDCLYINVFAPAAPGKNRTVMFWIYGGGLQFGSNSVAYYDGTSFAANQDVIIVAPNYRTGAFGFPMSPQLPLAKRNLGFLDQRLALDWVQRNIHAFGGSPDKVTIFGESAGAASVDELVTTLPKTQPFRAAIMESGQTSFYVNMNNSNTAAWDALMAGLKCTGSSAAILKCARAAKATTIKSIAEHGALTFAPTSDNVTQLEFPVAARAAGNIAKVPILTGTNYNEGRVFVVAEYNATNATSFVETTFKGLPQAFFSAVLAAYPQGTPGLETGYEVISQIYTEFAFQCPAAMLANSSATNAKIPTWRYLFNATFPNTQQFPDEGVYHSSEIVEVFGTYPKPGATQGEAKLSQYMQTAWANFAKNPSEGPGWAKWPQVGVLTATNMTAMETNVQAALLDQRCALYTEIYALTGQ